MKCLQCEKTVVSTEEMGGDKVMTCEVGHRSVLMSADQVAAHFRRLSLDVEIPRGGAVVTPEKVKKARKQKSAAVSVANSAKQFCLNS